MTYSNGLSTLELLEKLVSFDTTSSKSNLPLIDFVDDYLKKFDIKTRRFPNEQGDKAALLATIGIENQSGIILSGHTDVVPIDGQEWSTDPFSLIVKDGKAFGRGSVDMKGFIASALAAVPLFVKAQSTTPIHMLFSYDEEVNCLGSVDAITWLIETMPKPIAALVGEPTMMQLVDAHKNVVAFETTIRGLEAHSATPQLGTSAVMAAGALIAAIGDIADNLEDKGDQSGRFNPPYSSLHVATINGGNTTNILAKECQFIWELRCLPDQRYEDILEQVEVASRTICETKMNRFGSFGEIETVKLYDVPGLSLEQNSPAASLVSKLLGSSKKATVAYVTEGGRFQEAGISTAVCGPGSIDQAHKPDEYITLEQLNASDSFLKELAREIA